MDRRFLALTAATFLLAFAVFWIWFAPVAHSPASANVPDGASPAPAAVTSPVVASPPPGQEPPPSPVPYEAPPDPTVVHRLG